VISLLSDRFTRRRRLRLDPNVWSWTWSGKTIYLGFRRTVRYWKDSVESYTSGGRFNPLLHSVPNMGHLFDGKL